MQARLLHLHPRTAKKLLRLRKEAEADGACRVARRLHAVLLNHDGYTSGQIATLLKALRGSVSEWLRNYEQLGYEGLLEGHRPGRPPELTLAQRQTLADIVGSGPVAYGFSVQRPKRKLARADAKEQDRWQRYDYPNLKSRFRVLCG
jgi:hypothetical protein